MPDPTRYSAELGSGAVTPAKHNYTGSAIAAGTGVKIDASNVPTASALGGVTPTTATTDMPYGVVIESIPIGGDGRVLVSGGCYPMTAKGAITYGDVLMPGSTSGTVSTQTSGKSQIGFAESTAADGGVVIVRIQTAKNA